MIWRHVNLKEPVAGRLYEGSFLKEASKAAIQHMKNSKTGSAENHGSFWVKPWFFWLTMISVGLALERLAHWYLNK